MLISRNCMSSGYHNIIVLTSKIRFLNIRKLPSNIRICDIRKLLENTSKSQALASVIKGYSTV